ncbi:MAG: RHS repeat protein, partial [Verrucomicrobia bacterium]|nr:RHS repeat protein [Verrucomicrobiota bacterium]
MNLHSGTKDRFGPRRGMIPSPCFRESGRIALFVNAGRKNSSADLALNVPKCAAQCPTVTVVSQYGGGQTETGKVYVPPATESFTHDADGNLTSDGRWTYSWDAENRL